MDPIYECSDTAPGKRMELINTFALPILIALIYFSSPSLYRLLMLAFFTGYVGVHAIVMWPLNRIRIYADHIEIGFGAWLFFRKNFKIENIVEIIDASDWTTERVRQWGGWYYRNQLLRRDQAILAFKTTHRKFLVSSPDRQGIFPALISVLGEEKVQYDPEKSLFIGAESTRAWKPSNELSHGSDAIDSTEPILHVVESGVLILGLILGAIVVLFLVLTISDGSRFGWADLVPILLIAGPVCFVSIIIDKQFLLRFVVDFFPDRIEISRGLFAPDKDIIEIGLVTRIQPVIADFEADFPFKFNNQRIRNGTGKWEGWKGLFINEVNTAVAIETDEDKYVFGCRNSEEVSEKLKTLLNGVVTGSQKP